MPPRGPAAASERERRSGEARRDGDAAPASTTAGCWWRPWASPPPSPTAPATTSSGCWWCRWDAISAGAAADVSGAYALGVVLAGLLGRADRAAGGPARRPPADGGRLGRWAACRCSGCRGVHALWQFYLLWAGGLGLANALTFYPVTLHGRRQLVRPPARRGAGPADPAGRPGLADLRPPGRRSGAAPGLARDAGGPGRWCSLRRPAAARPGGAPAPRGPGPAPRRRSPREEAPRPRHLSGLGVRAALRLRAFWTLTVAYALATLATSVLLVHAVAYLIGRGYGGATAAAFVGAVGLASLPGRLGLNLLSDRVGPQPLLALCLAAQAAGVVLLLHAGIRRLARRLRGGLRGRLRGRLAAARRRDGRPGRAGGLRGDHRAAGCADCRWPLG